MLVVSDTHRRTGHGLPDAAVATLDADPESAIVHAGDFTTGRVLDAFQAVDATLYAVHGNADGPAVTERLPPARTVTRMGLTIAVTHTRRGGQEGLALFGREREADLVVSGHTHEPGIVETRHCTLLNPGSHTGTRAPLATYATLEAGDDGIEVAIRGADGELLDSATVGDSVQDTPP